MGAGQSTPAIFTNSALRIPLRHFCSDGKSKTEFDTRSDQRAECDLRNVHGELAGGHQPYAFPGQDLPALKQAILLNHHQKPQVIAGCGNQAATAGQKSSWTGEICGSRSVSRPENASAVENVCGCVTVVFFRRHKEAGVFHVKWLEKTPVKKIIQVFLMVLWDQS